MTVLRAVLSAFSMFSALPTPPVRWEASYMRNAIAALPLVGLPVALLLWGWAALAAALALGAPLTAAGFTLLPVAVSGGIHLDGYADTVDALASHAAPEKKREILKDPRAGAFAVIGLACYLLLYFALAAELPATAGAALQLGLIQVFSRALGGFATLAFPSAGGGGVLDTFRNAAGRGATLTLCLFALASGAGLLALGPVSGAAVALGGLLCLPYLYFMAKRQFGGMSGDLAGFLIQLSQLVMLAALVLVQVTQRTVGI